MIYELRTYDLKVRALPEVIKRFSDKIENRQKLSTMVAFWYTEIGPLNQIIHCWQYEDAAERGRVRSEAIKQGIWPPKIGEFVLKQTVEIFIPWDNLCVTGFIFFLSQNKKVDLWTDNPIDKIELLVRDAKLAIKVLQAFNISFASHSM